MEPRRKKRNFVVPPRWICGLNQRVTDEWESELLTALSRCRFQSHGEVSSTRSYWTASKSVMHDISVITIILMDSRWQSPVKYLQLKYYLHLKIQLTCKLLSVQLFVLCSSVFLSVFPNSGWPETTLEFWKESMEGTREVELGIRWMEVCLCVCEKVEEQSKNLRYTCDMLTTFQWVSLQAVTHSDREDYAFASSRVQLSHLEAWRSRCRSSCSQSSDYHLDSITLTLSPIRIIKTRDNRSGRASRKYFNWVPFPLTWHQNWWQQLQLGNVSTRKQKQRDLESETCL